MTDNLNNRSHAVTDFDLPTKRTSILVQFDNVYDPAGLYDTLDDGTVRGGFGHYTPLVRDGLAVDAGGTDARIAYLSRLHANAPQMIFLLRQVVELTESGVLVADTDEVHEIATMLAVAANLVEHVGTPDPDAVGS